MKLRVCLAAVMAFGVAPALADEVWSSDIGDVVYDSEVDGVAIFTFDATGGGKGELYFPGLAGNYDHRGTHKGYWIAPGGDTCLTELTGADGLKSKDWGQLTIVFHETGFPTGWTLMSGTCFGPLDSTLLGTAKVGDATSQPEEPQMDEVPADDQSTPPPPPPPKKNQTPPPPPAAN